MYTSYKRHKGTNKESSTSILLLTIHLNTLEMGVRPTTTLDVGLSTFTYTKPPLYSLNETMLSQL